MKKRAIIGILGSQGKNSLPWTVVKTDFVNEAYSKAVISSGGVPLILPPVGDKTHWDQLCELCDGFLFPGGEDIDPSLYGEDILPVSGSVNIQTDLFWKWVYEYAVTRHKPILGICRGMQMINVAAGGSLYQDLSLRGQPSLLHNQKQERGDPIHWIRLKEGSVLARILGTEKTRTNTMHHQCIKEAGKGLEITAWAADGVSEGLENKDGSVLLVQWHPEEMLISEPRMEGLFRHLIHLAEQGTEDGQI